MLRIAQGLLMFTYAVLPPALLAWAFLSRNRSGRVGRIVSLLLTFIAGTVLAVLFILINARLFGRDVFQLVGDHVGGGGHISGGGHVVICADNDPIRDRGRRTFRAPALS